MPNEIEMKAAISLIGYFSINKYHFIMQGVATKHMG